MENQNEIKKYFFNSKEYDFRLSRGAKNELEDLQNSNTAKMQDIDPEIANLIFSGIDEDELAKLPKEEQARLNLKALPVFSTLSKLGEIDVYETGFILLKNNLKYKDEMTRDYFEQLVFNMEEQKGFEETYMFFKEIRDNVFTILQKLKEEKEKKKQYKKRTKEIIS